MIRFQCPDCDKKLSVPDASAGKVAICPECKGKVRIPDAPADELVEDLEVEEQRPEPPPEKPPSAIQRPAPKPAPPPAKKPAAATDDDDEDAPEVGPARRKNKKKKKRRSSSSGGLLGQFDPFLLGLIGAAAIGFLSLIPAVIWPAGVFVPFVLASIYYFAGAIWFLIIAFMDDAIQAILCMCVPFYFLYYAISNFNEVKWPFFVLALSFVIDILALVIMGIRGH
jgi:hypothetical protein